MPQILIINQHGENRGDEAAMRAMLAAFSKALPGATFTVLYQFRDRTLRLRFDQPVDDLPIVLPIWQYLCAGVYTLFKLFGLDAVAALPKPMRRIIDSYRSADLVVSAPGGPYFGDYYAGHEIVHWWYVLLARLHNKTLVLYAPSAGPFCRPLLNLLRRRFFRYFDLIASREEISAHHILELMHNTVEVFVTADSALQADPLPDSRVEYTSRQSSRFRDRQLLAVSLIDFRFQRDCDADNFTANYHSAMLNLIEHLAIRGNAHVLFAPQLYGQAHDDTAFLRNLAARLSSEVTWEIVDPNLDSDGQRRVFGMCDLHVSSRYHPTIFGHAGFVPGISIYYEHKALGFMKQVQLERFAFDIWRLDETQLILAADDILSNRAAISAHLRQIIPLLRRRALRTTELAVQLYHRTNIETRRD